MIRPTTPTVTKPLRAAVFGMGGMGKRHVQALQAFSLQTLAVCDTRAEALEGLAASTRRYDDWRTLLRREANQLDLAVIATNAPSHAEITIAAAEAGINYILCEKPMATSGAKARSMVRACEATGTRLAVNFTRRFVRRYQRLKTILKSGVIGRVHHVSAHIGAGGLGCIGTHYFDLVGWLTDDEAVSVQGEIDENPEPCVRGPQFFDPGGRGVVRYRSGMTAFFELSGVIPIAPRIELVGTKGSVHIDELTPPFSGKIDIWIRAASSAPNTRWIAQEKQEMPIEGAIDVVESARHCLTDLLGPFQESTAAAGLRHVDTVLAFHLSSRRSGEKVMLPLTGEDLLLDVPIT